MRVRLGYDIERHWMEVRKLETCSDSMKRRRSVWSSLKSVWSGDEENKEEKPSMGRSMTVRKTG